MQYDEWPELTVRSWRTVLAKRDPDWGSQEEDHDGIDEAYESRRLHELRGIIIGQVAEIENLLYYITSQIHERYTGLPGRPKRPSPGGILQHLEDLLRRINADRKTVEKIAKIKKTIKRRNKLVHATQKRPVPKTFMESFTEGGIKLWEIKAPQRGKNISRLLVYRESGWNMFVALARAKKSQGIPPAWKKTACDRVKGALREGGPL